MDEDRGNVTRVVRFFNFFFSIFYLFINHAILFRPVVMRNASSRPVVVSRIIKVRPKLWIKMGER